MTARVERIGLAVGSVCSGIGAPECAWHPLGWRNAFFSEIDAFPRAVLAHRFPGVPVHGDFTTIQAGQYDAIDLLVGGTPCQSFSVAGLRKGMADERGNLALEYLRLADRLRPRWLVWENVPGVLSSSGGRDFGAFVGGLGELGYGFAYRVLDAQHFGVPQRRRRVFVVGYLGDWRPAAAVLFEPHSMQGHPAPRREKGEAAPTIPSRRSAGGGFGTDFDCDGGLIARCGTTGEGKRQDYETTTLIALDVMPAMTTRTGTGTGTGTGRDGMDEYRVAHTLRASYDASEDGTGRGTPLVPVSFPWQLGGTMQMPHDVDLCGTLVKNQTQAVAFNMHKSGNAGSSLGVAEDRTDCLRAFEKSPFAVQAARASAVCRLTPRECERLQGFPDDWTAVPYRNKSAADGPRYKALGNSMAVPVLRWIGERIATVEAQRQGDLLRDAVPA
jgi:DNA (cytosine-5)-methyltransferase 1